MDTDLWNIKYVNIQCNGLVLKLLGRWYFLLPTTGYIEEKTYF